MIKVLVEGEIEVGNELGWREGIWREVRENENAENENMEHFRFNGK